MDLRLLRTFLAVTRHESFTGAAEALGYTQSAVSQHVAALETSLGVTLFERRPFGLTPAAVRLAEHAATILLRVDVARAELAAVERQPRLAMAATPFAAASPEAVGLLLAGQQLVGAVEATLTIAGADDVRAAVARAEASVALVDGIVGVGDPLGHPDPGLLTALVVRTAPLAVALPAGHPFADRPALGWSAVADARWLDAPQLRPEPGPGARAVVEGAAGRARYDGADPNLLGALVAAGQGLALVPSWWVPAGPSVRLVELVDPPLVHRVEALVLRPEAERWAPLTDRLRKA